MPFWGFLILLIFGGLFSAIGSLPQFWERENKEIEERIVILGEKVYCQYCVIDVETGKYLVQGEKFKDFQYMPLNRTFYDRHRKVLEFTASYLICDKMCKIIYWANAPQPRPRGICMRCVTADGISAGLR